MKNVGYVVTDKISGRSYDTDRDGYITVAEAIKEHPERFTDATEFERRQINDGAETLGWRGW